MNNYCFQNTINGNFKISGFGVHNGKKINMFFYSSEENTGVLFKRIKLNNFITIPSLINYTDKCKYSTNLLRKDISIFTIEHLLFSLFCLNIDNVIIKLDANEIPILNGSSNSFFHLLNIMGIKKQNLYKMYIKIKKNIFVNDNFGYIYAKPSNTLLIDMSIGININFNDIYSKMRFNIYNKEDVLNVSMAKTFGFFENYKIMKNKNFINGVNFMNSYIYKNYFLYGNYKNYANEIVKHKILDFCGDLFLFGKRFIGHFYCYNTSHFLNNKFLNLLLYSKCSYDIVYN